MNALGRRCFVAGAALLLVTRGLTAQTLAGTVLTRADSSPVAGTVVLVLDGFGTTRGRALTDDRGHFAFHLPTASYRLRAMRIGLRALTTDALWLHGDTSVVLRMAAAPSALPAMTTREEAQCNLRPDSALALGALWEDAKTALLAAAITREKNAYRFDLLDHVRTFDIGTGDLRGVSTRESRVYDSRTWASLPPDDLRRAGYVVEQDDSTLFVAPDIETLLSPYFADTHCLRIARTFEPESLLAIEFLPARNFGHAEVRGRLWIDKRSRELRSLDFHYVNLAAADSLAGGSVDFARLPTGAWVMTDWSIRAPLLRLTTEQYLTGYSARRRPTRGGYAPVVMARHVVVAEQLRVTGGTLRGVWRDSVLIWAPPARALDVRVTTGYARSRPTAGETIVYLVGTGRFAVADSDGTVRFNDLVHGAFLVDVGTTQLDVLGWPRSEIRVDLGKTPLDTAEVNIASPIDAARVVCGDDAKLLDQHTGVLIGAVTRGDEAIGHRDVTVSWTTDARPNARALVESRTFRTLSGDGRFLACGVPRDRLLSVRVENTTTTTRIAPDRVVGIVDVAVKP